MGYRPGDPTVTLAASIEHQTAKAYLISPTLGGDNVWIPKSQVVSMEQVDTDEWEFTITQWIADRNGLS